MDEEKLQQIYQFLKEINKFKSVERLSLVKESGRRESDAEHTWHLVMSVWLYSSILGENTDLLKSIKIALVHDLVEIYAGDVYGGAMSDERSNKEAREKAAAKKLFSQLPDELDQEFQNLWDEYEQKETMEAQYVWALDKIAPRFQLTITKNDATSNMPTDHEKLEDQEEKIKNISPIFGEVLNKIREDTSRIK